MNGALRIAICFLVTTGLSACYSEPIRTPSKKLPRPQPKTQPRIYYLPTPAPAPAPKPLVSSNDDQDGPPDPRDIPPNLAQIPDAVPVPEPFSAGGNSRTYEVYGKTYKVMASAHGYRQEGKASWYGKKFHGRKTSSGERYDMFAMTAAHRSLPIPSYVRVTNLSNGLSCIVRVNDRGPFHSDRIIDLSYAAATRLDMLHHGAVPVEVEAIVPRQDDEPQQIVASAQPVSLQQEATTPDSRYIQVGAFADPINALSLRENLRSEGLDTVEIRSETRDNVPWHRVLVGPFTDHVQLESARQLLQTRYPATPVAN
jgi:rare lipoprotein A